MPFQMHSIRAAGFLATILAATSLSPLAHAGDTIVFDTTTGVMTVNGLATTYIGGATITDGGFNPPSFAGGDGAHRFIVHGDLVLNGVTVDPLGNILAGDRLTANGLAPLSLVVTNNVRIGFGATVDVSARGTALSLASAPASSSRTRSLAG